MSCNLPPKASVADEAKDMHLANRGSQPESRETVWLDWRVLFRRALFDHFHLSS
jgi:hypothetical protein